MQTRPSVIVFTDLDGTLLDHRTYSHDAANEALELLRAHSIPLVLASSKTAAEIVPLRERLGFGDCAAIVENGAGILEAGQNETKGSDSYRKLLDAVAEIDEALRNKFRGFDQLSAEEVAKTTSLSVGEAQLAKARQFSEPGIWRGSKRDFEVFKRTLSDKGIVAQQGGRFVSLSFGGNKADRLREIAADYAQGCDDLLTIALGDSLNDINMLRAADIGIIVANPHGVPIPTLAEEVDGQIVRTTLPGPSGWNQAVIDVLTTTGRI